MKTTHLVILFFFGLLYSCEKFKQEDNSNDYFFGHLRSSDDKKNYLLKINTRFDDCGEWGGHNETIVLFAKDENLKIYAKYIETKVDCETLGKYGNLKQDTIKSLTLEISESQKTDIKNYLKQLIDFKSNNYVTGNSGISYSVISQDSTLNLYTYNNNTDCKLAFKKLKSKLNF